jgi:secreted trypsin-like serine protease
MSSCGCSTQSAIVTKIIRSEDARPNTWGWTVSLRSGNNHLCGGSILNQWYIITAAHCLEKRMHSLSTITICAGTTRLSGPCSQTRSAQHVINHSEYNNGTMENDIALIRVNIAFDFANTSIARICLPNATHHNEYPQVGRYVIAVGWGQTEKENYSDALQQVTVRVVNRSEDSCHRVVRNHRLQLCATALGEGMLRLFKHCLLYPFLLLSRRHLQRQQRWSSHGFHGRRTVGVGWHN